MITFPNAKINIGLYITSRRPDGYHDIETLFYPIELNDILEIVPASGKDTTLSVTGINVDGDTERNLVMRAYRLLQKQYDLPPVEIHLHKIIPFGAGLGGGSSDAAFTLRMLRDIFSLPLSDENLAHQAGRLGADCPFFLYNHPLIATGIGDCFSPIDFSLRGKHIVLVKPPVSVSTNEAYAHVTTAQPVHPLREKLTSPVNEWRNNIVNDFEKSVFPLHPRIAAVKQQLYELGAVYASMSGSGSSVFGLFETPYPYPLPFFDCFVWEGKCNI